MNNKSIQSRPHILLVLQLVFGHESLRLFLLHHSHQLVVCVFQSAYLLQVLKLRVKVQTVMFENKFLLVFLGLRFKGVSNTDDSVDIVPANFKIIFFEFLILASCPPLVILKSPLILFLMIVICTMNAGEDEVGVVLQIGIEIINFLIINSTYFSLQNALLQRPVLSDLMDS